MGRSEPLRPGHTADEFSRFKGEHPPVEPDVLSEEFNKINKLVEEGFMSQTFNVETNQRITVRRLSLYGWMLSKEFRAGTKHDFIGPRVSGSSNTICSRWPTMPLCREILADPKICDPHGIFHRHQGGMPLMIQFCYKSRIARAKKSNDHAQAGQDQEYAERQYGPAATNLRKIKKLKDNIYKETGVWPWWIYHPSEKNFWSLRADIPDDGLRWRYRREEWTQSGGSQKELDEYEQPWIDMYGEEAHLEALEFTETYFQDAKKRWPTYQGTFARPTGRHRIIYTTCIYIYIYIAKT